MAFCPKCKRAMGTMESVCPSCEYDFLAEGDSPSIRRPAVAYSQTSTVALVAGAVGAGLGAAWAVLVAVASAFQGQIQAAAVALLVAMLLAGFLGVFLRVSER